MKEIKLTQNQITIVDDDVYEWASKIKWCANLMSGGYYVVHNSKKNGHRRLHRLIMNAKVGEVVDHINGDTLDNRKENLRICSRKENSRNQKLHKDNTSGYKGLSFEQNKWRVRMEVNGKKIHLGSYPSKEEAANAYNEGAIKYFGKYARINKL